MTSPVTAAPSDHTLDVAESLARRKVISAGGERTWLVDYHYSLRMLTGVVTGPLLLWFARDGRATSWGSVVLYVTTGFSALMAIVYAREAAVSRRFWEVVLDEAPDRPLIDRCRVAIGSLGWQVNQQGPDWLIATTSPRPKDFARVVTIISRGDRVLFNSRRLAESGRRAFVKPGDDKNDLLALLAPLGAATIVSTPRGKYVR
jgi:hypothetical protein